MALARKVSATSGFTIMSKYLPPRNKSHKEREAAPPEKETPAARKKQTQEYAAVILHVRYTGRHTGIPAATQGVPVEVPDHAPVVVCASVPFQGSEPPGSGSRVTLTATQSRNQEEAGGSPLAISDLHICEAVPLVWEGEQGLGEHLQRAYSDG